MASYISNASDREMINPSDGAYGTESRRRIRAAAYSPTCETRPLHIEYGNAPRTHTKT